MRKLRQIASALALALASAAAWAGDSQRINLWPVFYYDPPDDMVCFPFFARDRESFLSLPVCWGRDFVAVPPTLSWYSKSSNGLDNYIALCGLFDMGFKGGDYAESWLLPLFYHDRTKFLSPLVGWGDDFEMIPAALSWRSEKGGSVDYRALLGLGGVSFEDGSYDRSWLLPLYYHDRDAFLSLAVCWGRGYGAIPAALSWYRETEDHTYYRTLLGLGGASFAGGSYDRSWLFPLYYHDAHQFLSPLVGWGDHFWAIPAALSWRSTRGGYDSYRVLLGLGGVTFEGESARNSWLFPLFYRNDECFLTPLVGWSDRFQAIPAALSWHETAGARESYRLLLGMGSATWSGDQYERSWLLPLYYHGEDLFLSPLSFLGKGWGVCPAALSWYWKDGADESYLALLGLGGLLRDEGGYDRSWLFPFYYHDAHRFLSPLVSWGDTFEVLPALLSWHAHMDNHETYLPLLGLGGLTYRDGQYASSWLLPFFYHDADGCFLTLPYGRLSSGWCIPALLTFHTTGSGGCETWFSAPLLSSVTLKDGKIQRIWGGLGLLFGADYAATDCDSWSILLLLANYHRNAERESWNALILGEYSEENGKYAGSYLFPFYSHDAGGEFVSLLPYSTWTDKANRRNDLYGYCLLKSAGGGYSRWSFLWKFFDYENERGNVSVDAFPGITYDATADGTVDFSFWYRLFRYRSTPRGLTNLSVFFIPFK